MSVQVQEGDLVELVDMSWAVDHNMTNLVGRPGVVSRKVGAMGSSLDRKGRPHPLVSVSFDNSHKPALDADDALVRIGFDASMTRRPHSICVPAFALAVRIGASV